jgi:hypothetical protein
MVGRDPREVGRDLREVVKEKVSLVVYPLPARFFSERHLENLASQANRFDAISGFSTASDCFISSRPAIDAIDDVIWGIVVSLVVPGCGRWRWGK